MGLFNTLQPSKKGVKRSGMLWFGKPVPDPMAHPLTPYDEWGIDKREGAFDLHYTLRPQPDLGGARNYSYDNKQRPLHDICGTAVVVPPIPPIGCRPLQPIQQTVLTGAGRWSGQIFSAPLIDPDNPSISGYNGTTPQGV